MYKVRLYADYGREDLGTPCLVTHNKQLTKKGGTTMEKAKIIRVGWISVYVKCPYCGWDDWAAIDPYKMKRVVECETCSREFEIDITKWERRMGHA